ncbi:MULTISPECIES: envelope integrity protein Cei [Actinokineospora]|uniref:envelope integrity protein Cei n=1 Tax=Actinokineospora TaxID=39845 RepID=UPI001E5967CF|nr:MULTISPECIES: envelope integrity protein Cei [Actinokineospora]
MQAAPRYRKRRPVPALVFLAVLAMAAGLVWMQVLEDAGAERADARTCPASPLPAEALAGLAEPMGEVLPHTALDDTTPAPARTALVRVLNASGQNRQATAVSEALSELGFSKLAEPKNDMLYPEGTLACYGQIRFGQKGVSAARTLSILVPCAELVRDNRQDATVDLAVGQRFGHVTPRPEGREVLDQLAQWTSQSSGQGGLQGESAGPDIDGQLMAAARDVRC